MNHFNLICTDKDVEENDRLKDLHKTVKDLRKDKLGSRKKIESLERALFEMNSQFTYLKNAPPMTPKASKIMNRDKDFNLILIPNKRYS